jgi:hypothetical protein
MLALEFGSTINYHREIEPANKKGSYCSQNLNIQFIVLYYLTSEFGLYEFGVYMR